MSRTTLRHRATGLASTFLALVAMAVPAGPAWGALAAVDFDDDSDPTTIRSQIDAEVGDFVQASIAVDYLPAPWRWLSGIQFGLDLSPGLRLAGARAAQPGGGVLHDGTEGIAIAFQDDIPVHELPVFVVLLTFEVMEAGTHSVQLVPSSGWDQQYSGVLFAVRNGSSITLVEDDRPLGGQIPGQVMAEFTPVEEISWGAIKRLFSDDTL